MKNLIIYFSRTGENYMENGIEKITKGNTEKLVENLQKLMDADIFKVEPLKKYPENYYDCCDIAKEELEHNIHPELVRYLDDIDSYDTIYLAGPVWWGHYPCGMFSLFEKLDFTNKNVYYLTTHEGSGLGDVLSDVKKYCKGAIIKDGLAIRGCKVDMVETTLKNWLNK